MGKRPATTEPPPGVFRDAMRHLKFGAAAVSPVRHRLIQLKPCGKLSQN